MSKTELTNPEDLVEYGFKRIIIVVTVMLCAVLEIIDGTIVDVAIKDLTGGLSTTVTSVGWVITAYMIANIIIIPMTSWFSKQFGRRNYFVTSVVIFTAASFFCGNATTLTEMIIFRFIQGLGGGALLVTAQTVVAETYPQSQRGMSQAIFGIGMILGPTLGPPLGGVIIDNFSWRYIFYVNIPLGIIGATLAYFFVKSPNYGNKLTIKQVDWWGVLYLVIFVFCFQFILESGQRLDWLASTKIVSAIVISLFTLVLFIWRELVYDYPIVNIRVLKDGNLRIGTLMTFVLGFGLFGSSLIVPLYTQDVMNWTATKAGLIMIPSAITTGLLMPIIGKIMERGIPLKYLIIGGLTLFFLYSLWMHNIITPDTGPEHFFWPLVVRGLGLGLLIAPISTLALSTLKGKEIGEGASFIAMMQQSGGSAGVAIITMMIERQSQHHRIDFLPHLQSINLFFQERLKQTQQLFIEKGYSFNNALDKAYKSLENSVMEQSKVLSYMDVFLGIGLLFLVCVPLILFFVKRKAGHEAAKV